MANYQETRVKLTNTQSKKLKCAAKNNTVATLMTFKLKNCHMEFFLTKRQTTTMRNDFANNMSTDIKLCKTKISEIIQSGGSFGSWLGNLGKKALANIAISLARDNLPGLVSNLSSNSIS